MEGKAREKAQTIIRSDWKKGQRWGMRFLTSSCYEVRCVQSTSAASGCSEALRNMLSAETLRDFSAGRGAALCSKLQQRNLMAHIRTVPAKTGAAFPAPPALRSSFSSYVNPQMNFL